MDRTERRLKLLDLATRHGMPAHREGPAKAAIEVVEAWERWLDYAAKAEVTPPDRAKLGLPPKPPK